MRKKISLSALLFLILPAIVFGSCDSGEIADTTDKSGTTEISSTAADEPDVKLISAGVDFSSAAFDYLFPYLTPPDAAQYSLVPVTLNDGTAGVKLIQESGGVVYLVIDASSLLGDKVGDLVKMKVTITADNPSGNFYAVSGDILAYSGAARIETGDGWSVYLETKNPNTAVAHLETDAERFVPDAYNFFILTKNVDTALAEGAPDTNLVITGIHFYDENDNELAADSSAVFNKPQGFGEIDRTNLFNVNGDADETPYESSSGESSGWGQAVNLSTVKNGGQVDGAAIAPDTVFNVYYTSATPPELILQSWTDGHPDAAGWAKVSPYTVNISQSIAQYVYPDMVAAFGTDDFETYLDAVLVGDTGVDLRVANVTVGKITDWAELISSPPDSSRPYITDVPLKNLFVIPDSSGKSENYGQAVAVDTTLDNGLGIFDPSLITKGGTFMVKYNSQSGEPPELILQSWTDGHPDSAGWAKVQATSTRQSSDTGEGTALYRYDALVEAFGTTDFALYLNKIYVGDTGSEISVYALAFGIDSINFCEN
ncbi:hypothetical protein FACS1894219_09630 [Clostridia bacterium]|nr:hypothetical protein FACS1894219_09630 [Clostridia bacterium]